MYNSTSCKCISIGTFPPSTYLSGWTSSRDGSGGAADAAPDRTGWVFEDSSCPRALPGCSTFSATADGGRVVGIMVCGCGGAACWWGVGEVGGLCGAGNGATSRSRPRGWGSGTPRPSGEGIRLSASRASPARDEERLEPRNVPRDCARPSSAPSRSVSPLGASARSSAVRISRWLSDLALLRCSLFLAPLRALSRPLRASSRSSALFALSLLLPTRLFALSLFLPTRLFALLHYEAKKALQVWWSSLWVDSARRVWASKPWLMLDLSADIRYTVSTAVWSASRR